MFKAMILICVINDPTQCMFMENTRYPVLYNTLKACETRLAEMKAVIPAYVSGWKVSSWSCIKMNKGRSI